jgi:hypothetical protein
MATSSLAFDEWTKKDTEYQLVFTTLLFVDHMQTREIVKSDYYYEANPILGRYPTMEEVEVYHALCALGHAGIAYMLPEEYRRVWQCVWIGIETHSVYRNYQVGIRIEF